jgi:hypothetical protein
MVGYQGWFTCENGTAAKHWVEPDLSVDMLPDVSEYNSEDLCTLPGYNDSNGNPIKVFSSQTPGIVNTHFEWMKKYGIDGAFVQEFLSKLKTEKGLNERLNVTKNVKNSAEKYGRAWAIMFDVSAAAEDSVPILEEVMPHFNDMIKNSPMYLRENGKPLVAVWGIGGEEGRHLSNPVKALKVVQFLKNEGYSVFGGMVKNTWKDNYGKDSDWTDLVNSFDVVSPWVVG